MEPSSSPRSAHPVPSQTIPEGEIECGATKLPWLSQPRSPRGMCLQSLAPKCLETSRNDSARAPHEKLHAFTRIFQQTSLAKAFSMLFHSCLFPSSNLRVLRSLKCMKSVWLSRSEPLRSTRAPGVAPGSCIQPPRARRPRRPPRPKRKKTVFVPFSSHFHAEEAKASHLPAPKTGSKV